MFQVIISIYFGNLLDLFLITGHGVKFLVIHYRVQIIQEEFISSIHVNLASFYSLKIISQDYFIIEFCYNVIITIWIRWCDRRNENARRLFTGRNIFEFLGFVSLCGKVEF